MALDMQHEDNQQDGKFLSLNLNLNLNLMFSFLQILKNPAASCGDSPR